MKIEELLRISVEDGQWLEAVNENIKLRSLIDEEVVCDYIAIRADEDVEDELDTILYCFDAKGCLGMIARDFLDEYLNVNALMNYFEVANQAYCDEHDLCTHCRTQLTKDDDHECPNGC